MVDDVLLVRHGRLGDLGEEGGVQGHLDQEGGLLFWLKFCGCEEEEGLLVQTARGSIGQGLGGFGSENFSKSDLDPLLVSIGVVGLSEEDAVGGGDGQRD